MPTYVLISGGIFILSDFERKLLRILFNYSSMRHSMPTIKQLERMTGRTVPVIERGLDVLVEKQYILWSNRPYMNPIIILKEWEQYNNGKIRSRQLSWKVD